MKKYSLHILVSLLVIAAALLFYTNERSKSRQLDERISFRKRDKIPYGTYVAYRGLKGLFPKATIATTKEEPGFWDSLSNYDAGQALIIICPSFNATEDEMKNLIRFAEEGNDVFISAKTISYDALQLLKCNISSNDDFIYFVNEGRGRDSLSVSLGKPPFHNELYTYPGQQFDGFFNKLDSATCAILGHDKNKNANFIQLKAGKGNFFVHIAPMAFTNYFLLHKNNIAYYENALSVISPHKKKVVWDEYYIARKQQQNPKRPNWFSGFLKHPSLKWALLTALLALLVYVLLEMKRKQRIIPVIKKPANDSLDFVKTIGRLYHDKGDHKNLAKKMSAYFLEHVRSRYKLATSDLSEDFENSLHVKTGVTKEEANNIVSFIRQLDKTEAVSEQQLAWFHKQLESFYKKA